MRIYALAFAATLIIVFTTSSVSAQLGMGSGTTTTSLPPLYTGQADSITLIAVLSGSTDGQVTLTGVLESSASVSIYGDAAGYNFVRAVGHQVMGASGEPTDQTHDPSDTTGFGPDHVARGQSDSWSDSYSISAYFADGDQVRTYGQLRVRDPNGVTSTALGDRVFSGFTTINNDF